MLQVLATLIALVVSMTYSLVGPVSPDAFHRLSPLQSCSVGATAPNACDPVNLVFPGKSWEQVRDALRDAGWTTTGFGSSHVVDLGIEGVVLEDEQLFFVDSRSTRFHIRLWQTAGQVTFASVHHETEDLEGLRHRVDKDWEAAEAFVAGGLCPAARTCSQLSVDVEQDELQGGDGQWLGWANDARLTVIVLR